jgi:thiol-disulfide isomerase/thioredoxin
MNSRRVIVLLTVAMAGAAFWLSVRMMQRSDAGPAEAPQGEPIALQFYRDPSPVPTVSMTDLNGRVISSESWRGKVTIVNFWATWCPPCRAEIPDLVALQKKYGDRLQIIGVSEDEDSVDVVKQWAAEHKMNYPVVMTTPELRKAFPGVSALPTSFIIDREVRVVQRHVGILNPATTEAEARSLAGLAVNASIEQIEKDQPTKLANAAQATTIPGVDLTKFSKERRVAAIMKLNDESCTCGCNLSVAKCRVDDPSCKISLPRAQEIVDEIARAD